MYKLIIVDDEIFAQQQLAAIFDWQQLGFELAGTFHDGNVAIKFIEDNHVDAIITDIKMPKVSGIALSQYCSEKHPDIKIIMLSAFRDFSYAQKAIEYNVISYVTKPIIYSELKKSIEKLKNALDSSASAFTWRYDDMSVYREQIISEFLNGTTSSLELFQKQLKTAKIDYNVLFNPCALVLMNIENMSGFLKDKWKYEKEALYSAINNVLSNADKDVFIQVINYSYSKMNLMLLYNKEIDEYSSEISDTLKKLEELLSSLLSLDVGFKIIQSCQNMTFFKRAESSSGIISYQASSILSSVLSGSQSNAMQHVDTVFSIFKDNKKHIVSLTENIRATVESLFSDEILQNLEYADIENLSVPELKEYTILMIDSVSDYFAKKNQSSISIIIRKATDYINRNYNRDITRESVAKHIAITPNYFSTYFKKETGYKFIDYLNKIRIDNAMKLIRTNPDITITAVCYEIGFSNLSHFYKMFKLYTGMTPAEYKTKFQSGEIN